MFTRVFFPGSFFTKSYYPSVDSVVRARTRFRGHRALIETAVGHINGVTLDFTITTSYVPGSTVVFLNGLALSRDLQNGWYEKGGNLIQLKQAPLAGDVVQVYFSPL